MNDYVYRFIKDNGEVRQIPFGCRYAVDQEECCLYGNHPDVRVDVPTVLVHDGSVLLDGLCRMLWHVLVHQEANSGNQRQEVSCHTVTCHRCLFA